MCSRFLVLYSVLISFNQYFWCCNYTQYFKITKNMKLSDETHNFSKETTRVAIVYNSWLLLLKQGDKIFIKFITTISIDTTKSSYGTMILLYPNTTVLSYLSIISCFNWVLLYIFITDLTCDETCEGLNLH